MATIEPYCSNRKCGEFPSWFSMDALLAVRRCPVCASRLRFRCSACGRQYPEYVSSLQWCAFCGAQFDRAETA